MLNMSRTKEAGPITGTILGVIFAVVGYFVAFSFGKPILDNAKASSDWPNVNGKITRSAVATKRSDGKTMFSFDVVYKYEVEGKQYTCNNVYFGGEGSSSSSSSANGVVSRYPKGSEVKVYYEPANPGNAVLEPGTTWSSYLVYGVGMVFLVIGVLVAGGSLIKLLAFGAVIFGAASGVLGGSKRSNSSQPDHYSPNPSSGGTSRTNPPDIDDEDDGFGI